MRDAIFLVATRGAVPVVAGRYWVTTDTKIVRGDSKNAADLTVGDRVNVRATACKADLTLDATPALTAVRLVAHPATP